MYSPILNRFTSRDPEPAEGQPDILYGADWVNRNIIARMNPYAYVENNPVNYVDPSGLDRCNGVVTACDATGPLAIFGPQPNGKVKIGGKIDIFGDFINKGDCKCKCCKVELWVRGEYFLVTPGGVKKPIPPHKLPGSGKPLDPKVYGQDSPTLTPTPCKVRKTDFAGLGFPPDVIKAAAKAGLKIELHYDFELRAIDVCAVPPETVGVYDFNWDVRGDFVAPAIVTDLAPCAGVKRAPPMPIPPDE